MQCLHQDYSLQWKDTTQYELLFPQNKYITLTNSDESRLSSENQLALLVYTYDNQPTCFSVLVFDEISDIILLFSSSNISSVTPKSVTEWSNYNQVNGQLKSGKMTTSLVKEAQLDQYQLKSDQVMTFSLYWSCNDTEYRCIDTRIV